MFAEQRRLMETDSMMNPLICNGLTSSGSQNSSNQLVIPVHLNMRSCDSNTSAVSAEKVNPGIMDCTTLAAGWRWVDLMEHVWGLPEHFI